MGRHDVPRGRRDPQVKSWQKEELLSRERKRKRIYRVRGQRSRGDQKEDGTARGPADPDGSPDTPELTGGGGLTCQQDAERHKTKKTPTPWVGHRAAPSRSHLASRLSGSFPSPPLRQWVL